MPIMQERYGKQILQLLRSWLSAEENPAEYERVIRPIMDELDVRLEERDPARLLSREERDTMLRGMFYSPYYLADHRDSLPEMAKEYGIRLEGKHFFCVTTMIGLDTVSPPSQLTVEQHALLPFLCAAGESVFNASVFDAYGVNGGQRILFLLAYDDNLPREEMIRAAVARCRKCQQLMLRWLDAPVSFLLSHPADSANGLHAAYEQTRASHCYLCSTGNVPVVLTYGEMLAAAADSRVMDNETYMQLSDTLYGRLRECFRLQRFPAAMDIVREIIRIDIAHTRTPIVQEIRARKLVCFLWDNLQLLPQTVHDRVWTETTRRLLWIDTLPGAEKSIQPVFDMLTERFCEKPDTQRTLIESLNQYIAENFADPDLSVSGIAEHFHLSQGYLAAVVKAAGEPSILDSIQKRRLEEAKRLLQDTSLSVSRIAARVGYAYNAGNLTRVFKRKLGLTPQEFRSSARVLPRRA